jgi:hypothetical protein
LRTYLFARIVFVNGSQTECLLLIRASPSPLLERAGACQTCFRVEVIRVDNERLSLGVKNASVGFVRLSIPSHVVHVGEIQVARTHQFTDVATLLQQLALIREVLLGVIELRVLQSPEVSRRGREGCARRCVPQLTSGIIEADRGAKKGDTRRTVSVQSRPENQSDNRRTRGAKPLLLRQPQSLSKVLKTNTWSTHDAACSRG